MGTANIDMINTQRFDVNPPPSAMDYIQDGLIAMWDVKHSPPTKQTWNASVGEDLAFSLHGTSVDSDGGLQFAGLSNSYGELSQTQSAIFPSSTGTLEIVFKLLSVPSGNGGRGGVVMKTPTNSRFGLGLFGRGTAAIVGSNNVVSVQIMYDGSNPWSSHANDFIAVSVVYTNSIKYYLNGVAKTIYNTDSIGGSQTVTRIGSRTSTTYPFHGNIYAIRVYSKQLTAEEITHNHAIDKVRFNLPMTLERTYLP